MEKLSDKFIPAKEEQEKIKDGVEEKQENSLGVAIPHPPPPPPPPPPPCDSKPCSNTKSSCSSDTAITEDISVLCAKVFQRLELKDVSVTLLDEPPRHLEGNANKGCCQAIKQKDFMKKRL